MYNPSHKNYRVLIKYSFEEGINKQIPVRSMLNALLEIEICNCENGFWLSGNAFCYSVPNYIFTYICRKPIDKINS
jgi:hypothetical protein